MTALDPRPNNLAGPRHLVAGTFRQRAEQAAVVAAVVPYVAVLLVCVVLAVQLGAVWFLLSMAAYVAALWWVPIARRAVRYSYWRCRWWFDCRACGLCLNAERGVFRADAGADDDEHRVVAPFLRRLSINDHGRVYTVRCLPGQTPATFVDAAGRMASRWNAADVDVRHVPGDRYVFLIVNKGLPPAEVWTR